MKLVIKYVKEHGDLQGERIVLKALEDIEVGNYMIADTTYMNESEVSNKLRHPFWIPDKHVGKGDLIVIYTKKGRDTTKNNESGNKTHFFYWGLRDTIWNKDGDAAVVFAIKDWTTEKV